MEKSIVIAVSSMGGGGAERVAALLSNHWADIGYRVTLVPTFSGRGESVYPLHQSVRVEYLADHAPRRGKSPLAQAGRLLALRRLIKSARPALVISFLPHVNVATIVAVRGLKTRLVVSERTYPPAMPIGFALSTARRLVYPWADRVVMQTQDGLNWLTRACPGAKGVVIPNPFVASIPSAKPMVSPAEIVGQQRRLLLAVGRLSEEKQYPVLLDAFNQLASLYPDWDLIVLGEGPERQVLESQIVEHGLLGRIQLLGHVGNPADWYGRADAFVAASRFEGFPNALLEALGRDLPSVSFDCMTGPRDLIEHGRNGLLVDPSLGPKGLANALGRIMSGEWSASPDAAQILRTRLDIAKIARLWIEAA